MISVAWDGLLKETVELNSESLRLKTQALHHSGETFIDINQLENRFVTIKCGFRNGWTVFIYLLGIAVLISYMQRLLFEENGRWLLSVSSFIISIGFVFLFLAHIKYKSYINFFMKNGSIAFTLNYKKHRVLIEKLKQSINEKDKR